MKRIYTSIDIGSDTIKIIVSELYKNKLNLLAATTTKSRGIKKGLIADVALARHSVVSALNEVKNMLGININKVIALIPEYFLDYNIINTTITIENEQKIVTGREVAEVINSCYKKYSDEAREILKIVPIDFKVDDKQVVDPKGVPGNILALRSVMITSPKKNIYSVVGLLESIGLEVVDISVGSIGDMEALKLKDFDKKVGVIVNIGSETTKISLFNKNVEIKNTILQLGGKNIDSDISYIYKLDPNVAELVKIKLALAHKKFANNSEIIKIENNYHEEIIISQPELSEIVYSRLEEMLNLIKKEINALANRPIDYIIVTGGTSNIPYLDKIVTEILGSTIIGKIKTIGIRNNKYSSAYGVILDFINTLRLKGKNYSMVKSEEAENLSSPRKNNINETNIWKALAMFFDE